MFIFLGLTLSRRPSQGGRPDLAIPHGI